MGKGSCFIGVNWYMKEVLVKDLSKEKGKIIKIINFSMKGIF